MGKKLKVRVPMVDNRQPGFVIYDVIIKRVIVDIFDDV